MSHGEIHTGMRTAPGQVLWGESPKQQPLAPLVLLAALVLLIAAPAAMAGNGGSANPLVLLRQIADTTYELTNLMTMSNASLAKIDANTKRLFDVDKEMDTISASSAGMAEKTAQLSKTLEGVGGVVSAQKRQLSTVQSQLGDTAGSMSGVRKDLNGSLKSTKGIVTEFTRIDRSIGSMNRSLKTSISAMGKSAPLTEEFANNRTRIAVAGGSDKKYNVPNLAPNNRVMSVVLPMISTMQQGGSLPARKDSHKASNPIVGTALKMQVPDGTNVNSTILPYDGFYGLPNQDFFVNNRIHGF